MKRTLSIVLLAALLFALCGCGNDTPQNTATDALFMDAATEPPIETQELPDNIPSDMTLPDDEPADNGSADDEYYSLSEVMNGSDTEETVSEPELPDDEAPADEIVAAEDVLEAAPTPAPTLAPNYSLLQLQDTTFGFNMVYPAAWENLPGKYTLCYREVVEADDCPARLAVTRKHFAHAPNTKTAQTQFKAFGAVIKKEYPSQTFEWGVVEETTFMGKKASEISYLAYIGNTEVKGYMVSAVLDHNMYIFHFVAPLEDYVAMEGMMKTIRDSIREIK